MEQRRYPRIQLPLLVELGHPSFGLQRCIAKDISEGGVLVYTHNPQLKPGANVKLTLQNPLGVEAQPTPTVEMEVKRVAADCLGLAFTSSAGRHLWQSVERLRTELAIGRDYFQVHLNAIVISPTNAILLVQQHGKWAFPATFLLVGMNWQRSLQEFLQAETGVEVREFGSITSLDSGGSPELPEAAVLSVFVEARAAGEAYAVAPGGRYRGARWAERRRDLSDATFANEHIRQLAERVLKRLALEDQGRTY
jgi:ADP-ribose pyrophosphatase YjhB (NUDIX family)